MTDVEKLAEWRAAYALERQLLERRLLEDTVWQRHDHLYQMYWVYAGSNWRSMNDVTSTQVRPSVKEKPKKAGQH